MALSEGGRGVSAPEDRVPAQLQCSWGTERASAWGLGGNGKGVDGTDSDPEVVMIIGVLMTLNWKQCHIHSTRAASFFQQTMCAPIFLTRVRLH